MKNGKICKSWDRQIFTKSWPPEPHESDLLKRSHVLASDTNTMWPGSFISWPSVTCLVPIGIWAWVWLNHSDMQNSSHDSHKELQISTSLSTPFSFFLSFFLWYQKALVFSEWHNYFLKAKFLFFSLGLIHMKSSQKSDRWVKERLIRNLEVGRNVFFLLVGHLVWIIKMPFVY
jgi:hypothetical protein